MLNYADFFGPEFLALTSDASVDFRTGNFVACDKIVLTAEQKAWLDARQIPCDRGPVFPKQVHGDGIWEARGLEAAHIGGHEADAVVTAVPGLPVAVRTADCLPVLIADPVRKVVAAVHAGWRSTQADIVQKTIRFMHRKWLVKPSDLKVVLGPCIRPASYEVGEEFLSIFPGDVITKEGRHFLDLASANRRRLLASGVRSENIFDCGLDTFTAPDFFSFRRDGEKAGRMLSVILIR